MTDSTDKVVTEQIPSSAGTTSGIASANAPIIFADEVPIFGYYNGIVHITLEAARFNRVPGAQRPVVDRVVVAHLRMNKEAFEALKLAIAGIDAMIADPATGKLTDN